MPDRDWNEIVYEMLKLNTDTDEGYPTFGVQIGCVTHCTTGPTDISVLETKQTVRRLIRHHLTSIAVILKSETDKLSRESAVHWKDRKPYWPVKTVDNSPTYEGIVTMCEAAKPMKSWTERVFNFLLPALFLGVIVWFAFLLKFIYQYLG